MADTLYNDVRWLIGAIARGLFDRQTADVATVLERLAGQDMGEGTFRQPPARTLPVVRYFAETIAETMMLVPDLAAALAAVDGHLQWLQSAAYNDSLLGEGFLQNYGWCEIIGPKGFFAGDDFLLGLLLLGPHRHYRDHYHPAPELYWPLTGGAAWKRGSGALIEKPAGVTIFHQPNEVHATKTAAAPLLAVWSWTSHTTTPARLVD
jgi:hypothetical protein